MQIDELAAVPSTYTGSLSSFVYLDSTSTSPNSTATLSVCTCACASSLNYMYLRSQMIRISEHLVWTTSTCCSSYKHTHIYGEFKRGPGWVLAGASFTLCLGLFGTGPAPARGRAEALWSHLTCETAPAIPRLRLPEHQTRTPVELV